MDGHAHPARYPDLQPRRGVPDAIRCAQQPGAEEARATQSRSRDRQSTPAGRLRRLAATEKALLSVARGLDSNRLTQEGLRPIGLNQRIAALNQQTTGLGAPRPNGTPANASRPGINPPNASQGNNSRPGINPPNASQGNNARPGIKLPNATPGNVPRYVVNGSTPARNPVGQGVRDGLIAQSRDAQATRPQQHVNRGGLTKPGGHTQN
jgi:hypothetical protein